MKFSIKKKEKYTLFTLEEPRLDAVLVPDLKKAIHQLLDQGYKKLILDLSYVTYTDSSGLSLMVFVNRAIKEKNGVFAIANPNQHLVHLLQITKLNSILKVFPTLDESIAFFL